MSQQPSETSRPWNFLKRSSSKVHSNEGELAQARAEQASRAARGSKSTFASNALNKSGTHREGDGAADSIGKHVQSKRSRPSSASSVKKLVGSASGDELLEKSPLELSKALLDLLIRSRIELLLLTKGLK